MNSVIALPIRNPLPTAAAIALLAFAIPALPAAVQIVVVMLPLACACISALGYVGKSDQGENRILPSTPLWAIAGAQAAIALFFLLHWLLTADNMNPGTRIALMANFFYLLTIFHIIRQSKAEEGVKS